MPINLIYARCPCHTIHAGPVGFVWKPPQGIDTKGVKAQSVASGGETLGHVDTHHRFKNAIARRTIIDVAPRVLRPNLSLISLRTAPTPLGYWEKKGATVRLRAANNGAWQSAA